VAIVSRIKSLVRYDYQSHGILLHPYYKSEIVENSRLSVGCGEFRRILDIETTQKLQDE